MGKWILLSTIGLVWGCAHPTPKCDLDTLQYLVASNQFVNEVDFCMVRGRVCALETKEHSSCHSVEETCVHEAYLKWNAIKKEHNWK